MNKISKKIVALVTMAAFVLTLAPVAAFAENDPNAPLKSNVSVATGSEELSLPAEDNASVDATITVTVGSHDAKTQAPIYVWLTKDDSNEIYRYATLDAGSDETTNSSKGELANAVKIAGTAVQNNAGKVITVTAEISEAGTYKVHAGIAAAAGDYNARTDLSAIDVDGAGTIAVEAASTYVDSITVEGAAQQTANGGTISYVGVPNGIRSTEVKATVNSKYTADSEATPSSDGKVLKVESPTSQIAVLNVDGKETNEITVDGNLATFYLKAASGIKEGNYTFTLTADDVSYRLTVVIGEADNTAATIEAVDTNKNIIAKADTAQWEELEEVAQFTVKNAAGDVLTPDNKALTGFTAFTANDSASQNNNNVDVLSAPKEGKNHVFKVVKSQKNTDNFVLTNASATQLPVGEYTVRVSLDNGKVVDFTFTVATPGKAVDMIIDTDVDTVVLGEDLTGTVKYVDENGLTQNADSTVAIGFSGNAYVPVNSTETDKSETTAPTFKIQSKNDDKYLGAVITVTAVDESRGFIVTKDITVVDGVTNGSLEFEGTNGPAFENNTVNVSVVDEDGSVLDITTSNVYAYVDQQGDEKANITVNAGNVKDGKGKLTVYSDKATTADIVVAVKASTGEIYAATLSYTFGEEDVNADKIVAMTIGSTDMIVDNAIVSGDAAPYIADGRTMVPIRALSETFGAEVDFKDNIVTIVDGDTTIVMTIGETIYTINDEEQTMDVAPVIGSGDRTYVPVRFVAEALGYKVTPLYAADGTTASVVFQK